MGMHIDQTGRWWVAQDICAGWNLHHLPLGSRGVGWVVWGPVSLLNTWILVLSWSIHVWKTSFMSVEVTVSMKQDLRHWLQFHICAMMLWGLTVFVASFIYVLPWHGSKPTRCHAVFAFTSLSFAFHWSKQGWKSLPEQILERWWNELIFLPPSWVPGKQHLISTVLTLLPIAPCRTCLAHLYICLNHVIISSNNTTRDLLAFV